MKPVINILILLMAGTIIGNPAYNQQINIPKVEIMPSLPQPFLIRDWADVAKKFDSLVYNVNTSGTNWPLVRLGTAGINYPEIKPVFMDSYVGSFSHGTQAEAINIIPSIIGSTLVGIDKSNQFGVNWVESVEDFFNRKNGQNVYLNGTSTHSGNDWWYDIMPNVFFYQLYSLYPGTINFDLQFRSVAEVWQNAIQKMGGSATPWKIPYMNYRAWNLSTQVPLTSGVIEPEAAGSLSWLMYSAYLHLGDKKYLYAAQMCMDFLNGLNSNPSYEIQLPYGALAAAKMNAELGSDYDVGKILNWVFDRGPLRGWGTITGSWNGNDVSGLVGEANEAGDDYAFVMNGFQQAAALVPLVKYDKRFARAIAKWILNLANASRFFYSQYIPEDHQDSYVWSTQYDPQSVIAYESLKQSWNGLDLFARGDAIQGGWASTNLSLYSSSHVGYMGSILHMTDVDGILSMDLNRTDFFGDSSFPTYLVYNPYDSAKIITLKVGDGNYDIYDAITERVIQSGASDNAGISVGADSTRMLVYLPKGSTLMEKNGKLYSGQHVVDYHYKDNFEGRFRIISLASQKSRILVNSIDTVYCTVGNAPGEIQYSWAVNGIAVAPGAGSTLAWLSPAKEGSYRISCTVSSGGSEATDTVQVRVDSLVPEKPNISSLNGSKEYYFINDTATINCSASDVYGSTLTFSWSSLSGTFLNAAEASSIWITPSTPGVYTINCQVENAFGLYSDTSLSVLVKPRSVPDATVMVYYPFDGDVKDYSGNGFDAVLSGAVPTTDPLGINNRAYSFTSSSDLIYTPNQSLLNFQDKITISFWLKLDQVPEEAYVISHGSWEDRYKVSVTPDRKLRWTVRTDQSTIDLDNPVTLVLNTYYHIAVTYTGYSMESYLNGDLALFASMTGKIQQTAKDLTIGHKDRTTNNYYLRGAVDEMRIYSGELSIARIKSLQSLWNTVTGMNSSGSNHILAYPNPSDGFVAIRLTGEETLISAEAYDLTGQKLPIVSKQIDPSTLEIELVNPYHGMTIFRLQFRNGLTFVKILFE